MARSEARLQFDLWVEGLAGLSAHAKLMYCVLLTEPTLNQAGVGACRQSRWARNASLTAGEAGNALIELADGGHIVIDADTEECLVRTIIRRDGVAEQPYVLKAALTAALGVKSQVIRWVLAVELLKLPPQRPDGISKSGKTVTYPDPHGTAALLAPPGRKPPDDPWAEPFAEAFETLLRGSGEPLNGVHPNDITAGQAKPFREGLEREGGRGRGSSSSHLPDNSAFDQRSSEIKRSSDDPPPDPPRADVEQLCEQLRERVAANGFKTPGGMAAWHRQARLLLDADKRELSEALRLVDWATTHEFWHSNIRSMDKFREKYDTLIAQARQASRPPARRPGPETADDKIRRLQAMKDDLPKEIT